MCKYLSCKHTQYIEKLAVMMALILQNRYINSDILKKSKFCRNRSFDYYPLISN